jgi:hypothetical protein
MLYLTERRINLTKEEEVLFQVRKGLYNELLVNEVTATWNESLLLNPLLEAKKFGHYYSFDLMTEEQLIYFKSKLQVLQSSWKKARKYAFLRPTNRIIKQINEKGVSTISKLNAGSHNQDTTTNQRSLF